MSDLLHALCEHCEMPVHIDHDAKRGWIHTVSGNYRCGYDNGFAAPLDNEASLDKSFNDGFKDGHEEGLVEGHNQLAEKITRVVCNLECDASADKVREAVMARLR